MKHAGLLSVIFTMLALLLATTGSADESGSATFVARQATTSSSLIGFTRARARIKLISQITDKVVEVRSDIGDLISKDGVFARFDTTLPELDLENIRINQKKIKSRITYLEKEAKRFRILLEKHSTAETRLDALEQELDQAVLSLLELESREKKAAELLDRHTVKATPGWQVINRLVEPGEWVTAGTPLADVGDYRVLTVPFAVSQGEYLWLQKNRNNLNLHLPELNTSVKAQLKHVSPGFDPVTRKMNIELSITSPLKEKRGGIRAELTIDLPDPSGTILVPSTAINSRYEASWLTTAAGDKIKVMVLGPGKSPGISRVASPAALAGDIFLTYPTSTASPTR